MASSWSRTGFYLTVAVLLLFSGAWVWHVGHRGLFVLDESIVFDGAWRIAQGQVPYRDFYLPFGPVTFLLPALIFHVVGPTFSGLVGAACIVSVVATAAALRLALTLTGSRGLALLAGALTAVWFQAPFGVPWMEQTAFLFDLLALAAVVESGTRMRGAWLLIMLAGASSAIAILSKQNAGGFFVPVCVGALFFIHPGRAARSLGAYAAGGTAVAAAFLAWLLWRSNLETFLHYWLEVSAETGLSRVETWKLVGTVFFQTLVSSSAPLFIVTSVTGLVALCSVLSNSSQSEARSRVGLNGWLALMLPQFHNVFQLTTNNDAPNNNAFVGICLAAGVSLLFEAQRWGRSVAGEPGAVSLVQRLLLGRPAQVASWLLGALTLYSLVDGLMIARDRNVQEFFGARFDTPLNVAGARGIWWGEPTRITPHFCGDFGKFCRLSEGPSGGGEPQPTLEREDFEELARLLSSRRENIFVFPDVTLLYGLTGHISPQPLLYFHPGQSFLLSDRADLDREITAALERNHVHTVVLERASFMGTHRLLEEFPRLKAWIAQEFTSTRELGNYRVLERR